MFTKIGGYLSVHADFTAPMLKEIGGGLSVHADFTAPMLKEIKDYLNVRADFTAPILTEIGSNLSVNADFTAPILTKIGGNLSVHADFTAPMLTKIGGNLSVHADFTAPMLTKIGGNLSVHADFPYLSHRNTTTFLHLTRSLVVTYKDCIHSIHDQPQDFMIRLLKLRHTSFQNFMQREVEREWKFKKCVSGLLSYIEREWDNHEAFTPKDIFAITDLSARRLCFQYLRPKDLMGMLGAVRTCTAGKELDYFRYEDGVKTPFQKSNVYEIWEAESAKLDKELDGKVHAVKCWCSSTDNEAWLWVDSKYKDDPLAAIASTFMVYDNVLPYITCIKRQGDIMVMETAVEVTPEGEPRPLTKEEYFGLLECET
jgi:hypothetical protein